jgi:hypothetical protein
MKKTDLIKFRISPSRKRSLESVSADHGLSVSAFLRALIDRVTEDVEEPCEDFPSKSRREGKITVRLESDVREGLEVEARGQGMSTSGWAARVLSARVVSSPQPVKGERRAIQKAFRHLAGLSSNLNQIAKAMNRGVFTGSVYAPTRSELSVLISQVTRLRGELRSYARGRFVFQTDHPKKRVVRLLSAPAEFSAKRDECLFDIRAIRWNVFFTHPFPEL